MTGNRLTFTPKKVKKTVTTTDHYTWDEEKQEWVPSARYVVTEEEEVDPTPVVGPPIWEQPMYPPPLGPPAWQVGDPVPGSPWAPGRIT